MTTTTVRTKHGELPGKGHPGYAAVIDIPFADALKAGERMRASVLSGKIVLDAAVPNRETSWLG